MARDLASKRLDALNGLSSKVTSQEIFDALNLSCGNQALNADYINRINFEEIEVKKVQFDIVDGCNLRCIGCPNSVSKPSVNPIPTDVLVRRIQNIDVGSIKQINLYRFGEPLFHPELPVILRLNSLIKPKIKSVPPQQMPNITILRYSEDSKNRTS